jgi:hypothetical protein
MTTLTRVQIPSSVRTMSTCQQKELNVIKGNTCSCFHPMWKPTSCAMVGKVSQIISWVFMCSLFWAQLNKWIPIGSMGCVHTHWRIPIIERCGSPNHVQNVMEKTKEDNWNINQTLSQTLDPRPKHDKIRKWWALDIMSESMLERVWWCKCSKMEF